jgi:diguanylate cyclase (GGDEF)-like protein
MNRFHFFFIISLLSTVLVGYIDHMTGAHISMMIFYAVPILLAARYCGKIEGLIVATSAGVCWFIVNLFYKHPEGSDAILTWNAVSRTGIFALIAYTVSLQAQLRIALAREILRADTDKLTGLFNKGAFRKRVEEEMNRARRYKHPLSLAFIDLDNFKQVNDSGGHACGDKLLQQVSETIVSTIRETDIAGRIGGDEFTICFPETGEDQARDAIKKLVRAFDSMIGQSGWQQVTASIGVVTCMKICDTYDALLGEADRLMYIAKEKGKNGAEFETLN